MSQDTIKTQTYQTMFSNEKRNKNTEGSIKYSIDGVMFPSDQTNHDTIYTYIFFLISFQIAN
jgi:hypothetical protein